MISAFLGKFDVWGARFEARIEQHPRWYLFLFSLLYFSITLPLAVVRELWFDEFITLYVLRFHRLSQLWATLKAGVDLNPPLYHFIVRGSEKLLGENAVGLRLPSVIAYWAMAVALFLVVRRRTNTLYGIAAASLPFITATYAYSFEARPYAIVLACCPFAFLCWQCAIDKIRRKLALAGLALTLAIAVTNHYYGVLLVLPLAIGELVRTATRKKTDWAVWTALAVSVVPLVALLPVIRPGMAVHEAAYDHIWNKPEITFLWGSYKAILGIAGLPILALLGWFAVRSTSDFRRPEDDRHVIPGHEMAAGFALAGLPILAYLLAISYVGMVAWRYVLPTAVGCAIIVAFTFYRASCARPAAGLLLVIVLLGWSVVHIGLVAREEVVARNRYEARDTALLVRNLNLPIVVQDGILALPMDHYLPPDLRQRMLFPVDLEAVRYYQEADTPERIMVIGKNTFPVPMEDFEQFRRDHKEYLVYGLHAGWLISTVIHDGGKAYMLDRGKWQILFLIKEKTSSAGLPKSALRFSPPDSRARATTASTARLVNHP